MHLHEEQPAHLWFCHFEMAEGNTKQARTALTRQEKIRFIFCTSPGRVRDGRATIITVDETSVESSDAQPSDIDPNRRVSGCTVDIEYMKRLSRVTAVTPLKTPWYARRVSPSVP